MEDVTDDTPKVLLCGPQRSGKTSILKVVLNKMSPHEAQYLESTPKPEVTPVARNALMRFKAVDFPGWMVFDDSSEGWFTMAGAVVVVIDAQVDNQEEALSTAKRTIEFAYKINPKVSLEVFIHKIDGDQFFSDDHKTEIQREIRAKLTDDLQDKVDAQINYHCTSLYDHSVYEALSKVVQKVVPHLELLERCLDLLITQSRMDKAFLFDVVSKVYIASDPQPVALQQYELCSDMIDVVVDISYIYGQGEGSNSIATDKSSCIIHLVNGTLLYLKEVDHYLALVCILREENFDRQHLLDHNIAVFKEALQDLFQASRRGSGP
jgi:Ras-related GTP-binding protein C/D